MDFALEGLKPAELYALEHTVRHFEQDQLRSEAAFKLGFALKAEIRRRAKNVLTEIGGKSGADLAT
jgi:regulator of RNase E activity RraB